LTEGLLPRLTGRKGRPFADAAGLVDWSLSVDSTLARAHQHATNTTRLTGGWIELHESEARAA
jgi:putative transposase